VKKKRESSGGGAGFARSARRQSVCLSFWSINFASRWAQKCWVVRWVWGLVLVRKVSISMDPYLINILVYAHIACQLLFRWGPHGTTYFLGGTHVLFRWGPRGTHVLFNWVRHTLFTRTHSSIEWVSLPLKNIISIT